ncbi:hypothetical protein POF50_034725 [Streptomyces sp. SL13]|uniref:BcpO-related WXXGXW repeat protein n=1 Tax=Streptantibioticus silvisoli TaxID=2705255 RepID=A0AA90KJC8_9ACTN|nr:hypothetical protein [Streptantibioticus silvisoli]MDI5967589.1 hypothetical protein [Streptantibioticus silvisoli]MDI5974445.1 hypothetical protein [Streptantibioticus silvisoli]
MAVRAKRFLAIATAGMFLAGGAALTTATDASAAPAHAPSSISQSGHHRVWHPGHWTRQWHAGSWRNQWHNGYWDNHHRWHRGSMSRRWTPGHWSKQWHRGYWS